MTTYPVRTLAVLGVLTLAILSVLAIVRFVIGSPHPVDDEDFEMPPAPGPDPTPVRDLIRAAIG